MKVRDLMEIISSVDEANKELEEARLSMKHGGNAFTMEGKQRTLDMAYSGLERLLDQDIDFD